MAKKLSFKVYRGGQLLTTESFDREIIKIGRLSSAHLRLEDEKVSRIHAVVEVSASGEIHIIDMGSSEGTFVNGEKVNKAPLKAGDEIRVGETRLVFAEGEAAAAETAAAAPEAAAATQEVAPEAPDLGGSEAEAAAETARQEAPPVQPSPVSQLAAFDSRVSRGRPQVEPAPVEEAPVITQRNVAPPEEAAAQAPEQPQVMLHSTRLALPPPKELGELSDDEHVSPDNWALEVRKLWGETVLDVKYFRAADKEVRVGDAKGVSIFLPPELLPDASYQVARLGGAEAVLSFPATAQGDLRTSDGQVIGLGELAKSNRVGQDPQYGGCKSFTLPPGGVATFLYGNVGLRFRYVSKPASFLSTMSDRLDYTFLNSILLMLFIFAAMVATFHLRPKSVETTEEELYKVPDRFVQFILTRPKPEKKDLSFLEQLKSDIDAKKMANQAERYKGSEGKMGKVGKPDTGRRSAIRAIKPDDKELVGNRGLLAVLGAGGPEGLSTVMGGTGLGGELEGAIGNMFGAQVGESGGFGGLGLRGTGTGGGGMGNTIGVGRLGTRGRGGGNYGYGTGVSRVKSRGERDVNISVGKPIIMGSLSMEIIRRVIQSHRDQIKYCYSQELTRNPNLNGKVSIKFTISEKGYVTQATVAGTTMNNASVERCLCQKILTWKFPEPKGGGIVIVNYPFIFKPE
ncbi:MAG TPA: AgmX/PglI C-terminal domain-containing protein [Myxococcota bacterium]|nr:AgmX/PglI C-terminal domain-containing protein [Myxococcota bacterium]HRY96278.1 AgmX/PglI C-terminal domain-containing protein [Myxococcota bacterium]